MPSSDSTVGRPDADGGPSDEELIRRTRQGNRLAFKLLVERYEDRVAATIIGMLGPGADAEDAGQETFLRLYERLDQFRGESTLGTYLTRIAINQALQVLRKRKRWTRRFFSRDEHNEELPQPVADTRDDVAREERKQMTHRALQDLSEEHRSVVVLRLLQGYSTKETAEILNIPEGTVMSRLYRASNQLKKSLAPLLETDTA